MYFSVTIFSFLLSSPHSLRFASRLPTNSQELAVWVVPLGVSTALDTVRGRNIASDVSYNEGIAWGALGAAQASFEVTRQYLLERKQVVSLRLNVTPLLIV